MKIKCLLTIIFFIVLSILIFTACGNGAKPVILDKAEEVIEKIVKKEEGAEFVFSDNTRIVLPENALSKDTLIKLTMLKHNTDARGNAPYQITFEPTNVILNKPIEIDTQKIPEDQIEDNQIEMQYLLTHDYQLISATTITVRSRNGKRSNSTVLVWPQLFLGWHTCKALYPSIRYPGKYLLPGDILYDIGNENWFTGHVGMYLGSSLGKSFKENEYINDGISFVDAYPYDDKVWDALYEDGVRVLPNDKYKQFDIEHNPTKNYFEYDYEKYWLNKENFLEPRRPWNELLFGDRQKIVDYAIDKEGSKWSISFNLSGKSYFHYGPYSCVGLVESAYKSAGITLTSGYEGFPSGFLGSPSADLSFTLIPLEQFNSTKPIDSITAKIDRQIKIPLAVYTATSKPYGIKWEKDNINSSITLESGNGEILNNVYYWTPREKGTYKIKIKFSGLYDRMFDEDEIVSETRTITIEVTEKSADFVAIYKGNYWMGNTLGTGYDDENPAHEVEFNYDYLIGTYELTNSEYLEFLNNSDINSNGSLNGHQLLDVNNGEFEYTNGQFALKDSSRRNYPMRHLSWWGAIEYCNWLSEEESLEPAYDSDGNLLDSNGNITTDITEVVGYRLPTEAEWEYAARGAENDKDTATDYRYAGSNNINEVGWDENNSGNTTHEVGLKTPNEIGLYDMSGNVREYCTDWHGPYSSDKQTNPVNLSNTSGRRVERSGGYDNATYNCRIANRGQPNPNVYTTGPLGFRIAKTK